MEACFAILAAWMTFLGRLGSLGEPQGGAMAAQGPPGVGAVHASKRVERGGWSLGRLQKPCQTVLGILPRLNVPRDTVADHCRWCRRSFRKRENCFRKRKRASCDEGCAAYVRALRGDSFYSHKQLANHKCCARASRQYLGMPSVRRRFVMQNSFNVAPLRTARSEQT